MLMCDNSCGIDMDVTPVNSPYAVAGKVFCSAQCGEKYIGKALGVKPAYSVVEPPDVTITNEVVDARAHDGEGFPLNGDEFPRTNVKVKPSDLQATRHACGVRFDLIPGDALAEVARTLANGAKKYGDNNWKESRMVGENGPINHALKHIHYYNAGIEDDESPDPNIHLANAITNLLFELHYNLNGR